MSQEMDSYLRKNEPAAYTLLCQQRDNLIKDYPNLVPNAWLVNPTDTEEWILVITFTSLDPNNPVSECFTSDIYCDPEFCFDDLPMDKINEIMSQPLVPGSWIGQ